MLIFLFTRVRIDTEAKVYEVEESFLKIVVSYGLKSSRCGLCVLHGRLLPFFPRKRFFSMFLHKVATVGLRTRPNAIGFTYIRFGLNGKYNGLEDLQGTRRTSFSTQKFLQD